MKSERITFIFLAVMLVIIVGFVSGTFQSCNPTTNTTVIIIATPTPIP